MKYEQPNAALTYGGGGENEVRQNRGMSTFLSPASTAAMQRSDLRGRTCTCLTANARSSHAAEPGVRETASACTIREKESTVVYQVVD